MIHSSASRFALLFVCAMSFVPACTQQVDEAAETQETTERQHSFGAPREADRALGAEACEVIESEEEGDFTPYDLTASAMKRPVEELSISLLPEWDAAALQPAFERIRDERFQCDPKRPNFARRLTWLRPAVSCEARAELVSAKLGEWGYPRPGKIFAFGLPELTVGTPNSENGKASWPWHVAAAVRVGDEAYVFDAAIEPRRPLLVEEWLLRMAPSLNVVTATICDANAFQPASYCFGEPQPKTRTALNYERGNFEAEWNLQVKLGRDPQQVLGAAPPWLQ